MRTEKIAELAVILFTHGCCPDKETGVKMAMDFYREADKQIGQQTWSTEARKT